MKPKVAMAADVFLSPEWAAFCKRFGIKDDPTVRNVTVRIITGEPVEVTCDYFGVQGPESS